MATSVTTCSGCGRVQKTEVDDRLAAIAVASYPDDWLRLEWCDDVHGPSPVPPGLHERSFCASCKKTVLEILEKSHFRFGTSAIAAPLLVPSARRVVYVDEYIAISLPKDNPHEVIRLAESYHKASVAVVREIAKIVPAGQEEKAREIFAGAMPQAKSQMESILSDSLDARKKPS